jgi:hypothetical protein
VGPIRAGCWWCPGGSQPPTPGSGMFHPMIPVPSVDDARLMAFPSFIPFPRLTLRSLALRSHLPTEIRD